MNFDILSQNLVIYVSIIVSICAYYLILSLYKTGTKVKLTHKKDKLRYKKFNQIYFLVALALAILIAYLIWAFVQQATDSPVPGSFILMCLPFTLLICVLIISIFIKKAFIPFACVTLVLSLLFSLLIINDYYRFYPTLGEVFGNTNTQAYKESLNSVTVHYTVDTNQQTLNNESIQKSLESIDSSPTAGKVYAINIPGTISKFKPRTEYVYIPAIYNSPAKIKLPVIVLTAGVPGIPANWLGLGLQNIMDHFASTHFGITPLVFVADSTGTINNDTECVNSSKGNVETYLTQDVPNYIKSNFNVDTSPKNWAIGGLSLGGMCSIMLTLRHPDVYNYFIDLGGELGPEDGSKQHTIDTLFGGSESAWAAHQPSLLLQDNKYPNIGGYFGDGEQDTRDVVDAIEQLNQQSKKAGINSVLEIINGAHTFNVWSQTYKDALPWISNRIGATQCSSSCI